MNENDYIIENGHLTIRQGVTEIELSDFQGCTEITEVNIPASVNYIGSRAFRGCTGLMKFMVDEKNLSYTSIDGVLFAEDKIVSKGNLVLECCPAGKTGEFLIPKNVLHIKDAAFADCVGLTDFLVDNDNPEYCSIDGVLFSKDKSTIVSYPPGRKGEYHIAGYVMEVDDCAFMSCAGLTNITIPESVAIIGQEAFSGCVMLKKVTLPSRIARIEALIFDNCSSLKDVNIPDRVDYIGWDSFKDCTSLKDIKIANHVRQISNGAFQGCTGLKKIIIPKSVQSICMMAFCNCTGLEEVTFSGNNVELLNRRVFEGCSSLTSIKCPYDFIMKYHQQFTAAKLTKLVIVVDSDKYVNIKEYEDKIRLLDCVAPTAEILFSAR